MTFKDESDAAGRLSSSMSAAVAGLLYRIRKRGLYQCCIEISLNIEAERVEDHGRSLWYPWRQPCAQFNLGFDSEV